jgi:hypothetical protein
MDGEQENGRASGDTSAWFFEMNRESHMDQQHIEQGSVLWRIVCATKILSSHVNRLFPPLTPSRPPFSRPLTAQLGSMYLHQSIKSSASFRNLRVLLFRITDGKVKHE